MHKYYNKYIYIILIYENSKVCVIPITVIGGVSLYAYIIIMIMLYAYAYLCIFINIL